MYMHLATAFLADTVRLLDERGHGNLTEK